MLLTYTVRFMDAEIGVRNLADTFRYNVLPDVVKAICQADGEFDPGIMDLEDVPEYKKLMLLVCDTVHPLATTRLISRVSFIVSCSGRTELCCFLVLSPGQSNYERFAYSFDEMVSVRQRIQEEKRL